MRAAAYLAQLWLIAQVIAAASRRAGVMRRIKQPAVQRIKIWRRVNI